MHISTHQNVESISHKARLHYLRICGDLFAYRPNMKMYILVVTVKKKGGNVRVAAAAGILINEIPF